MLPDALHEAMINNPNEKHSTDPHPDPARKSLRLPCYQSFRRHPSTLLVNTLESTDNPNVRVILMRGMLSGLSGRRNVDPPPKAGRNSARNFPQVAIRGTLTLLQQLSQIFGDTEAMQEALTLVQNGNAM